MSRFSLGGLYVTPGALQRLTQHDVHTALTRHARCDWGEMEDADWEGNDAALQSGERLVSVYLTEDGEKFWVITEPDRSATTILLPDEY